MKKILLLSAFVVIACMGNLYSQMTLPIEFGNSNTASYDELVSECIEPLDKSLVTSGLLGERGFLFTDFSRFNGRTDSVITMHQWWQLYRQLYLAMVSRTDLSTPENTTRTSNQLLRQEIVPIAVMNLDYHQIKPYALDSNLLVLSNGKLYDVIDRNESPYSEKHIFAATVLKDRIYHGRVTFRLDAAFFINNVSNQITSLEIDFDDGRGFRRFSQNEFLGTDIAINYWEPGVKTMTVKAVFSNQVVLQSKSSFTIVTVSNVVPNDSIVITGYNGYLGDTATGMAYILYGCGNNGKLCKPIIVSDGFDPGNKNHFPELHEMLNGENFVEMALAEGFDIIILDYDDGTDHIQRNARVMVSLIKYVNDQLRENESNSQLVVIGPSMGGLITRYALSYMEQKGMNHNTGLYVSFDAPHLGANIPLGDQFFIEYAADLPFVSDSILGILDSPAARQMLIYHHENQSSSGGHDPLRDELLSDPYFSFPTQCRKIAIANGSGEGTICLEPGEWMLSFDVLIFGADVWAIAGADELVFRSWNLLGSSSRFISGAKAYDGAPGGQRKVNAEIAKTAPLLFWPLDPPVDPVCFIPVISSLALQNTTDVNYNVHSIPGYPYPSSNITPFDAIYAPDKNQEHVKVDSSNIAWIMKEIGAINMYLQNKTVYEATDFEARNSITTGHNVVSYIPEGDFVVQNRKDEVVFHSEGIIRLKDGTHLMPWEKGVVRLCISDFPCELMFWQMENPLRSNFDNGKPEYVQQKPMETPESIAQTHSEKLPRNHPNPCGDFTTIEYELEKDAKVEIDVYSLMGIKLMSVEDRHNTGAGRYSTTINTSSLPSGMYIVVVRANGETNGVLKMQVNQ